MENPELVLGKVDKRKIVFSRIKRKIFKHVLLVRIVAVLLIAVGLYFIFYSASLFVRNTGVSDYTRMARNFIFAPIDGVKSIDGRTNILILGKGGEGHDAPDLTDTIIFMSVSHAPPSISMISMPRDIWVKELRAKLNSVYYWGNQKQTGGGLILAKSVTEGIVGRPVHYGLVLDFTAFQKIIDVLGGIEVNVEREFTDEKYPVPGKENDLCEEGDKEFKCRYETVHFDQGKQFMDGERALKFVRSRNAKGDEGTDFARSLRQQKVVNAIKNKIMKRDTYLSYSKMKKLADVLAEYIETDVSQMEGTVLAKRLWQVGSNIKSLTIPEDLFVNPPISSKYDNLYVFIPKDNNWKEVGSWIDGNIN